MVKQSMKKKLLILLAAVVAVTTPMVPQSQAISFEIAVGDRPYYHGGGYWHEGYYWVWVPGHYSHRWGRWVPGHYVRRDRKSTRLNSSHIPLSRMPSSA